MTKEPKVLCAECGDLVRLDKAILVDSDNEKLEFCSWKCIRAYAIAMAEGILPSK